MKEEKAKVIEYINSKKEDGVTSHVSSFKKENIDEQQNVGSENFDRQLFDISLTPKRKNNFQDTLTNSAEKRPRKENLKLLSSDQSEHASAGPSQGRLCNLINTDIL